MVSAMTDTETVLALRCPLRLLQKMGANLGETGCVAWNVPEESLIVVNLDENRHWVKMNWWIWHIESCAEDYQTDDIQLSRFIPNLRILRKLRNSLSLGEFRFSTAEVTMLPQIRCKSQGKRPSNVLNLGQNPWKSSMTYSKSMLNFDIPDEELESARRLRPVLPLLKRFQFQKNHG